MPEGTRNHPPRQNNYTRPGWWAGHGAEVIGAVAGFVVGFIVLLIVNAAAPQAEAGWIPWLTMLAGALGLRAYVTRQFRDR